MENNKAIPFFLSAVAYEYDDLILASFEDIISKENAAKYIGKPVYISPEYIIEEQQTESLYAGYIVFDQKKDRIGEILDTHDMQNYYLLEVNYSGKNILIPLHTNNKIKIDKKKKHLHVHLPDGILDL